MSISVKTLGTPPPLVIAMPLGIGMTFFLFAVMVKLIYQDLKEVDEPPTAKFGPIHYEYKPIVDQTRIKPIEKPILQDRPLDPEPQTESSNDRITINVPAIKPDAFGPNTTAFSFSGMPIAQYQPRAQYPHAALRQEIEGYVDVQFDITKFGTTENIKIIDAQPEGVFEKNTIKTVKRWRFQPKIKNGQPEVYTGMVQRISFEMQK